MLTSYCRNLQDFFVSLVAILCIQLCGNECTPWHQLCDMHFGLSTCKKETVQCSILYINMLLVEKEFSQRLLRACRLGLCPVKQDLFNFSPDSFHLPSGRCFGMLWSLQIIKEAPIPKTFAFDMVSETVENSYLMIVCNLTDNFCD